MALSDNNPFASPQFPTCDSDEPHDLLKLAHMVAILCVGLVGGAALGAMTNAVNGALSPQYFRFVMGWKGQNIWLLAVGQGALEGAIYGFVYAVFFVALIAIISRRQCSLRTALRYVRLTFALTLGFWALGGATTILFVWQYPHYGFRATFGYQWFFPALGYFAWVRGSIIGATYGGLGAVLVSNGAYALRRWSRRARFSTVVGDDE